MSDEKINSSDLNEERTKENFSIIQDMGMDKDVLLEDMRHFNIVFHKAEKLYKTFLGPYNTYEEVAPSVYNQEFQRSHTERQAQLKALNYQNSEGVEVVPNVIVFQGWSGEGTYTYRFTITNKLRVNQHNQIFKKIAHGITASFTVVFRPNRLNDYEHRICVSSSFHDFDIPIYAIGPRPMIDFPDIINFGDVPVKFLSQRIITLKNIGQVTAVASLSTMTPFAVRPNKISLEPGKTCATTVSFASLVVGIFMGKLRVLFDTGDCLCIKLMSLAENINVSLETDIYHFDETYVGMVSSGVTNLINNTDHILKFSFHKYLDYTDEMKELLAMERISKDFVETKAPVSAINSYYTGVHQHDIIADRIALDEMNHMNLVNMSFSHPTFEISPLVVFKNIGPIGGEVRYMKEKSFFGGTITTVPESVFVSSNEISLMCVKLDSKVVGTFYETLTFVVAETEKKLKIVIK
ncbi:uncharacterized protein LOC106662405 [Cimex lectularius]|uniref:HYDIN/VesB/CFA65-like Ig-like domain-containing protein n=1 Tax=Cimex lectularius TaxID=79782 RepID=A0A8I6SII3_CIMLE|nr:uncharacterized protein LOC106662405 [Cimex lectularius]